MHLKWWALWWVAERVIRKWLGFDDCSRMICYSVTSVSYPDWIILRIRTNPLRDELSMVVLGSEFW